MTNAEDYTVSRFERQLVMRGWSLKKQVLLAESSLSLDPDLYLAAIYGVAAGVGRVLFAGSLPGLEAVVSHLKGLNPRVVIGKSPAQPPSFSAHLTQGEPDPAELEQHQLVGGYLLDSNSVRLQYLSKFGPPQTIHQPIPHFVSSHHVISLLAISILINEVGNR